MAKTPKGIFMFVFIIVIVFLAYIAYNPDTNRGTSPRLTGGGGGESTTTTTTTYTLALNPASPPAPPQTTNTIGSSSGSPIPLQVQLMSMSAIRIRSDYLTGTDNAKYGYFRFTLFQDEDLTVEYINSLTYSESVYVKLQEHQLRGTGYTWLVQPDFSYNMAYWIKIQECNSDMDVRRDIGNVSFTTPLQINSNDQSARDKVERDLQALYDNLAGLAAGEALSSALKFLLYPDYQRESARALEYIIEECKISPEFYQSLKTSRVNFLKNISLRFNMFMDLSVFSLDDIIKIARFLPNTLKRLAEMKVNVGELVGNTFDSIIGATARGARYSVNAVKNLGRALGNAFINSLRATGTFVTQLVISQLNPVDIALLGLGIAGMVLDAENKDGMQDWKELQTADFLAAKETTLDEYIGVLKKHNINMIPAINGPFMKYSNRQLDDLLYALEVNLLMLPKFTIDDLPNVNQLPASVSIFQTLSEFGYIDTQAQLDYVENLEVMRDVRAIQDVFLRDYFNRKFNGQSGRNSDLLKIAAARTFASSVAPTNLHRAASYIMCLREGGNPLRDGQCSYRNASECFNSYPWPMLVPSGFQDTFQSISSPSPCPANPPSNQNQSPCLSNVVDLNVTDFFYSEWRDPAGLQRDFGKYVSAGTSPVWTDQSVLDANGACVIYPDAVRVACEASTKWSDDFAKSIFGDRPYLGKNDYNPYTGECQNTKSFCDAYRVDFRADTPPSDMGRRGSGPLGQCYQSDGDKAASFMFGGDYLVQGFEEMADFFRDAFRTWFSLLNGDADRDLAAQQAELARIAAEQALYIARSDDVQVQIFNQYYNFQYVNSETVSIVDFKIDPFGNIYVLYAYGTQDGTLLLRKFNQFFKPYISTSSSSIWQIDISNALFPFEGPLENFIGSVLAIDSVGSIYMIEFIENQQGTLDKAILKRDRDSGALRSDQWNQIIPSSLFQFQTALPDLWNMRNDTIEGEFNSIFIRNDNLYVIYSGFNHTTNTNISKLLKYTGITTTARATLVPTDIFPNSLDFMGKSWRSEEIFSFVVDNGENLYSLFLNMQEGSTQSTGFLTRISRSNGAAVYLDLQLPNFSEEFYQYDSSYPELTQWPSMCIDNLDNIFITNGLVLLKIDTTTFTATQVYNIETIGNFKRDLFSNIAYSKIYPWECTKLTLDNNDNICTINNRFTYINWGNTTRLLNGRASIITNRMSPANVPERLIKNLTVGSYEPEVDGVLFKNLVFNSNCVGYEKVTMFMFDMNTVVSMEGITPARIDPLYPLRMFGNLNDMIKNAGTPDTSRTSTVYQIKSAMSTRNINTDVPLPLRPNTFRLFTNTDYYMYVYMDNKFALAVPIRLDTTNFYIDSTLSVDTANNSEAQAAAQRRADCVSYRGSACDVDYNFVLFNKPIAAYGTRTLDVSSLPGVFVRGLPSSINVGTSSIELSDVNALTNGFNYIIRLSIPNVPNKYRDLFFTA